MWPRNMDTQGQLNNIQSKDNAFAFEGMLSLQHKLPQGIRTCFESTLELYKFIALDYYAKQVRYLKL